MREAKIAEIANRLVKKYDTNNPLIIAREMGINVVDEELGTIRGYYNSIGRNKFIHLNYSCRNRPFVCAHELGHAVLHPDSSTHFLRGHTIYSVSRFEKEATLFASHLLISDDDLVEHCDYTIAQLARMYGLDESIISMRFDQ